MLEENPNNGISNVMNALIVSVEKDVFCGEKEVALRERQIMALMGVVTLVQELLPPPPHKGV